jgi:hypothetical protein
MQLVSWKCLQLHGHVRRIGFLLKDYQENYLKYGQSMHLEKQALLDIANRLQRLKIKVDHLTFKTIWIKGKDNIKADAHSRHPYTKADPEDELDVDINVVQGHLLELNVCVAQDRHIVDKPLRELRDFCNEDANYKMIKEHVSKGFPEDEINIPDILMP